MKRLPWLLLLAALVLPGLALAPQSQHAFALPESALWLMLLPVAALLAFWSTRSENHPPFPKNLKRTLAALWVLWAFSALLALRQDLSLLALAEWTGLPLLFLGVWRLGAEAERRRQLVAILLAYGVLSTAYAALQLAGWDRVAWNTQFGGRTGAFLGNPNFLGGHLALLFPVALALALDRRQKRPGLLRTAWPWALVLILAAGLLLSQTRGAWLGAGVGAALVLILARRHMGDLLERNRSALLKLGLAAFVGLTFYFVQRPQAWSRIAGTFSGDGELARRAFLMKKAAQLATLQPLLGTGPGNFRIHFARVQVSSLSSQEVLAQPYVVGEHAHNDFLQMAAEAGWPAALLWALLMFLVLQALHQSFARSGVIREAAPSGLLGLGVFSGIAAMLVHGLVNFPFLILPTQGAAWALAAVVLRSRAWSGRSKAGRGDPAPTDLYEDLLDDGPASATGIPEQRYAGSLLALGLIVCAVSGIYNGRRLAMDRLWWVGQGELQLGRFEQAAPFLKRALALDRHEDRLWALQASAERGRGSLAGSIASLREAEALAPYDPEVALALGRALVDDKQYQAAETVLQAASIYAPNLTELWEPLGASLFVQGKYADAEQVYERMIGLKAGAENAYVNKAAVQGLQGQLKEALQTLKQAEERYPQRPKVFVNEVITYLKLGQKSEARAALKQAAQLDPLDPQIEPLKKVLR